MATVNPGKAVLAALGSTPRGNVQVMPVQAGPGGGGGFGFKATNPAFAPLADELTMWANGDLSFLDGRMGPAPAPDKGKRKRDVLADVLDGKSK